jgi:hypothetical protein
MEMVVDRGNSTYIFPRIETSGLEERFLLLVEQWQRETGMLSLVQKMVIHPAYQRIIGMGQPVVPLILRELEREPDHCFWALESITGANPVQEDERGIGSDGSSLVNVGTRKWLSMVD